MSSLEVAGEQKVSTTAWRSQISVRTVGLVLALLLMVIFFNVQADGAFLSERNLSLLLRQGTIIALLASGVSILIIMGEIDLSIGSAVYLTSLVAATAQVTWGMDTLGAVLVAVAVGACIGLVQGFVIVKFVVPSFIVTLAGLLVLRGLGQAWTNAAPVGPVEESFNDLIEGRVPSIVSVAAVVTLAAVLTVVVVRDIRASALDRRSRAVRMVLALSTIAVLSAGLLVLGLSRQGLPTAFFWLTAIGALFWFLMAKTTFGRKAYMIGSSREASVFSGINVGRTIFIAFVGMGVLYGITGALLTARLGASTATSAMNYELDAIAAAVIGGTSLRGGRGTVIGAIGGALFLTTIDNGMALMGVTPYAQSVVKGLILAIAVAVDGYLSRRRAASAGGITAM